MSHQSQKTTISLVRQIQLILRYQKSDTNQLSQLLAKQKDTRLSALLNQYAELRKLVFSALAVEKRVKVLDLVNLHTRRALVSKSSDQELVNLFEAAPTAMDLKIAAAMERSRLDRLISKISDQNRRDQLVRYANYPQRSVGRITQPEVVVVNLETEVAQAQLEVVGFGSTGGSLHQIYVTDKLDKFVGVVYLADLVGVMGSKRIKDLHIQKPPRISPLMTQKRVAQIFQEYDLIEAPVVKEDKLVGRVLVNDVLDVLQQEYTQDIQKLVGVSQDETLETSVFGSARRRLPWMVGNIFLDLVAVSVIMPFEATIAQVTALAVLMPIISDMGGNIGVQALAVSIRSLSHAHLRWQIFFKELAKELRVGLVNGLVLGLVLGVVAWVGWSKPYLGLVAMVALSLNTIMASVVGGLLPMVFKKLNRDPAMMSGALLTTITDFTGFLIFLSLARVFLEYLV